MTDFSGGSWGSLITDTVSTIPDNTVAHYDASQLSLDDGDTVSVWPDEQGDNDLDTQIGSPTYVESGINGNPAIAFDGDGLEGTGLSVNPLIQPMWSLSSVPVLMKVGYYQVSQVGN